MRGQIIPRVRIFEAWTAIDGPNGSVEHRGYAIAIGWLGFSIEFTVSRQVKL